MMQLVM
jgi:hypothetical protein